MSEEYNPQAQVIENIERLEVELKELLRKRDRMANPEERKVLDAEVQEMEGELRRLRKKLD